MSQHLDDAGLLICEGHFDDYLYIGDRHSITRVGAADLIKRLQFWLDHKRLPTDEEVNAPRQ